MASRLNGCGKVIKITLIVGNLLFLLLGLILTALGTFLVVELGRNLQSNYGDPRFIGAIIMISCGVFAVLVTVIGMIGAAAELWPVLFFYIICLILAAALDGSLGAYLIYNNLSNNISDDLTNDITQYKMPGDDGYDESVNNIVDSIQSTLKCCGSGGPDDWITNNEEYCIEKGGLPDSCHCEDDTDDSICNTVHIPQSTVNFTAWKKGCETALMQGSLGIAVLTLFMCLVQVLGILFSCCVCSCLLCNLQRRRVLHESVEVRTRRTYGTTHCERNETQD